MKAKLRFKQYLTQFRKLRNGSVFYKDSDGTGPFVKVDTNTLATNSKPTGSGHTLTAVADLSIACDKISKFSLNSQKAV